MNKQCTISGPHRVPRWALHGNTHGVDHHTRQTDRKARHHMCSAIFGSHTKDHNLENRCRGNPNDKQTRTAIACTPAVRSLTACRNILPENPAGRDLQHNTRRDNRGDCLDHAVPDAIRKRDATGTNAPIDTTGFKCAPDTAPIEQAMATTEIPDAKPMPTPASTVASTPKKPTHMCRSRLRQTCPSRARFVLSPPTQGSGPAIKWRNAASAGQSPRFSPRFRRCRQKTGFRYPENHSGFAPRHHRRCRALQPCRRRSPPQRDRKCR